MTAAADPRARYDFRGHVVVVTGGAAGIGADIVEYLHDSGATTVAWDLAPCRNGPAAHSLRVDVTDPASIDAAVRDGVGRYGRIDALVNSAGFAGSTVPLDAYDPDEWRRIIDVNLVGLFNVCRAVVPVMRAAQHGRIVNIASLAGKEGTPNASAYSAAKAGVIALTKSLGKELAGSGVLTNAVAPAAVKTQLLEQMDPSHVETMIAKSPLRRLGEPREVTELVAWLCSASCSFNTGAVFDLSGGRATY